MFGGKIPKFFSRAERKILLYHCEPVVSGFAYSVKGRVVMNRCNSKIKVDGSNKNDLEDMSGAKYLYTSFSKLAGTKLKEPRRRKCTIIGGIYPGISMPAHLDIMPFFCSG